MLYIKFKRKGYKTDVSVNGNRIESFYDHKLIMNSSATIDVEETHEQISDKITEFMQINHIVMSKNNKKSESIDSQVNTLLEEQPIKLTTNNLNTLVNEIHLEDSTVEEEPEVPVEPPINYSELTTASTKIVNRNQRKKS